MQNIAGLHRLSGSPCHRVRRVPSGRIRRGPQGGHRRRVPRQPGHLRPHLRPLDIRLRPGRIHRAHFRRNPGRQVHVPRRLSSGDWRRSVSVGTVPGLSGRQHCQSQAEEGQR